MSECACCGNHEMVAELKAIRKALEVLSSAVVNTKRSTNGGRTWLESGPALMVTSKTFVNESDA
jgi:hypothetical protein